MARSAVATATTKDAVRPMRELADQVREHGRARGLYNKDIASKLGMDSTWFSQRINRRLADAEFIERIANILKVSPWLFDEYVWRKVGDLCDKDSDFIELVRRYANAKPAVRRAAIKTTMALLSGI